MGNSNENSQIKIIKISVNDCLRSIEKEETILESLEILTERSNGIIGNTKDTLEFLIVKVFKDNVTKGSPLETFLNKKPVVPHEFHENYLAALACIIANLLQSDYGRTTQGGVEDFNFGPNVTKKLWEDIEKDSQKILQEFFGITPFHDTSRWDSIGFFVNTKWLSPEEPVK